MDLFDYSMKKKAERESPLAARMRPKTIEQYVGQEEILGEGKLLRRTIEADRLFSSIILWGPPGTGKTTLATVIANQTASYFETLSAVMDGKARLREVVKDAIERRRLYNTRTILFVDEVHRWNRAQQDALLPHVENGTVTLIGATTENPYFEVNGALVSRSRIFQLHPLESKHIRQILLNALQNTDVGFGNMNVDLKEESLKHIIHVANGDARNALNALELAVESTPPNEEGVIVVTLDVAQESIQQRAVLYDKDGDSHYDTISAFIKSIRGSDPDAAIYWLAKMLYAGEDPRFILRRLLISASEDIGLADPNALVVVNAAAQTFEFVGMPEGVFAISQATLYLATAPKSNTVGAYFKAFDMLEKDGAVEVPKHLKDGNRDAKTLGHGKDYLYPHNFKDHFIPQQYLPDDLLGTYFYTPSEMGKENEIKARLEKWRAEQREALRIKAIEEMPDLSEEEIFGIKRRHKSGRGKSVT